MTMILARNYFHSYYGRRKKKLAKKKSISMQLRLVLILWESDVVRWILVKMTFLVFIVYMLGLHACVCFWYIYWKHRCENSFRCSGTVILFLLLLLLFVFNFHWYHQILLLSSPLYCFVIVPWRKWKCLCFSCFMRYIYHSKIHTDIVWQMLIVVSHTYTVYMYMKDTDYIYEIDDIAVTLHKAVFLCIFGTELSHPKVYRVLS